MDRKLIITREPIDETTNRYHIDVEGIAEDEREVVGFALGGAFSDFLNDVRGSIKEQGIEKEGAIVYNEYVKSVIKQFLDDII